MALEHSFDEKGKVKPKPQQEQTEPQKEDAPISVDKLQGQLDSATLTQMQQTLGNASVQRLLAQRSESGPTEIDEETAVSINNQRGSGQNLDVDVAAKAGQTLGQDFSDVTVHTDAESDQLSKELGAKAFTTGNDIFFREGAYEPGSDDGQRLIAHELTHVVQQGASPPSVQGKMAVNDPNDQYEAEADHVADQVMAQSNNAELHEEEAGLQRQKDDELLQAQEEEEELIQAQKAEEEELVQAQEEEEEELIQTQIEPEEEVLPE
jgi:hypothetical protein